MTTPCHCGANQPLPIPALHGRSTGDICVCSACGTVYVPIRRSSAETAADWGALYGSRDDGKHYEPASPEIKARHLIVAESINRYVRPLRDTTVIDVGAGTGEFATMLMRCGAMVTAIEPSGQNVAAMIRSGINAFAGTAESAVRGVFTADIVTATWTLENASDARSFVMACRAMLRPGGTLVIATGSRILVPFKKRLSSYIAPGLAADLNPWRLSRRTSEVLLASCGMRVTWENRWQDGDVMTLAAQAVDGQMGRVHGDDPAEVVAWFGRWAKESEMYAG